MSSAGQRGTVVALRLFREPAPDVRRLEAELLGAEIRVARCHLGVMGTAPRRSR